MFIVWCESPFCQYFGWMGLMTCLIKILHLCDYWNKSDRVFAEMQINSYSFIILLKSIFRSIHNFEKFWCWKSDYHFLGRPVFRLRVNYDNWMLHCLVLQSLFLKKHACMIRAWFQKALNPFSIKIELLMSQHYSASLLPLERISDPNITNKKKDIVNSILSFP